MARRKTSRHDKSQLIDKTLGHLTDSVRNQFLEWCRTGPSYTQMQTELSRLVQDNIGRFEGKTEGEDYAIEIGQYLFKVWYEREFPKSDTVDQFNKALSAYQGVDHRLVPQQLIHNAVVLVNTAQEQLMEPDAMQRVSKTDLMRSLPGYIREVRGLMSALDKYNVFTEAHALRMQGAQRLVSELMATFKDLAHEEEIKLACVDAIEAVENWSLSENS